jgi:hypothetical protein
MSLSVSLSVSLFFILTHVHGKRAFKGRGFSIFEGQIQEHLLVLQPTTTTTTKGSKGGA